MDLQFIRERISELRIKKDVSEYKMSTELGHCISIEEPQLVQKLYSLTRNMSEANLNILIGTAERLNFK